MPLHSEMVMVMDKVSDTRREKQSALKIGEIAGLLGITPECVRYYEYEGLIRPKKDPANGYRLYSRVHLFELLHIIFLRKLGFNISRIKKTVAMNNTAQIIDLISDEKELILERMRSQNLFLDKLDEMERGYQLIETELGNCSIKPSPSFYIMAEIPDGDIYGRKNEDVFGGIFREEIGDFCTFGGSAVLRGDRWVVDDEYVLMPRKFAADLNIEGVLSGKKVIKSKRCGYTVCRIGADKKLHDAIENLILWLSNGGYHKTANPMFNQLITIGGKTGLEEYAEVFIPIV